MINLLNETLEYIEHSGHTISDIDYCFIEYKKSYDEKLINIQMEF